MCTFIYKHTHKHRMLRPDLIPVQDKPRSGKENLLSGVHVGSSSPSCPTEGQRTPEVLSSFCLCCYTRGSDKQQMYLKKSKEQETWRMCLIKNGWGDTVAKSLTPNTNGLSWHLGSTPHCLCSSTLWALIKRTAAGRRPGVGRGGGQSGRHL